MKNTIEKGNGFRDVIVALLEAAGFKCKTELLIEFKKVDIVASKFAQIEGNQDILIEAKYYEGNLDKDECKGFVAEYGQLVDLRRGHRAWLISCNEISPAGRALIESHRYLNCFTIHELQRRIFNAEGYVQSLIDKFESEKISEFYMQPHTKSNEKLLNVVLSWLKEEAAEPLAIIGGYGIGKTTFARALATYFAKITISDKTTRIPLLIPLGEVFDDQSIEGLVGKIFASQHRIEGYYFKLFEILNASGHFVIIFDGFDEMKHGMTISRFERNIAELLKLDKGRAKIIILGRDTAFQTDVEFRSIIQGQQQTTGGNIVQTRGRKPLRPISLREFTIDEAKSFITKFFPIKLEERYGSKAAADLAEWAHKRVGEIISGQLDHLIVRPVHAQMICEISTETNLDIASISKLKLYDLFVHYLIDRELQKRGRDPRFNIEVRRNFNAALAAWLWEKGGASTTSFADVPDKLCEQVARDIQHDLDSIGLRRELIAGCLVDKGEQTIYFSHRSIQEFLVAEYVVMTGIFANLAQKRIVDSTELETMIFLLNPEIVDFILEFLPSREKVEPIIDRCIPLLRELKRNQVPIITIYFMKKLTEVGRYNINPRVYVWDYWINAARELDVCDFSISDGDLDRALILLDQALEMRNDVRFAAILHWLYAIQLDKGNSRRLTAILVSRMLLPEQLSIIIKKSRSREFPSNHEDLSYLPLLALFLHANMIVVDLKKSRIEVDIAGMIRSVTGRLRISFDLAVEANEVRTIREHAFCTYNEVMHAIKSGGTAPGVIGAVDEFFEADDTRKLISDYLSGANHTYSRRQESRTKGTISLKRSN